MAIFQATQPDCPTKTQCNIVAAHPLETFGHLVPGSGSIWLSSCHFWSFSTCLLVHLVHFGPYLLFQTEFEDQPKCNIVTVHTRKTFGNCVLSVWTLFSRAIAVFADFAADLVIFFGTHSQSCTSGFFTCPRLAPQSCTSVFFSPSPVLHLWPFHLGSVHVSTLSIKP